MTGTLSRRMSWNSSMMILSAGIPRVRSAFRKANRRVICDRLTNFFSKTFFSNLLLVVFLRNGESSMGSEIRSRLKTLVCWFDGETYRTRKNGLIEMYARQVL